MVAIFGWIMPDPFAMPAIFISAPSKVSVRPAPLGNVSVVIKARAAASQLGAQRRLARSGTMDPT